MKLVQFTYAMKNDPPVYINPAQVVGVRESGVQTLIHVAVSLQDGGIAYFPVREDLATVVKMLETAG